MVFGVIGAMDEEIELIKGQLVGLREKRIAHMDFYEGSLGQHTVVLVACAAGKVNGAVCSQILIDHFGAAALIFTGVAGSLNDDIEIGDIVISTSCVHHDFDDTPLGYAAGENPDIKMTYFPADELLVEKAYDAALHVCPEVGIHKGIVATGDQFVADPKLKTHIVELFGALCAEMEGAALAQTAWLNTIPYVVVRAISDKANGSSHVDFRSFLTSSSERCANIVSYLVEHEKSS